MTPFQRLAVVATGAAIGAACAALWIFVSVWVFLGALAGAAVLTFLATLEMNPEPRLEAEMNGNAADLRVVDREPDVPVRVDRDTIERRARASREEPDFDDVS